MRVAHVLDYAGGSYIYVQLEFACSFKILEPSWNTANNEGWRTFLTMPADPTSMSSWSLQVGSGSLSPVGTLPTMRVAHVLNYAGGSYIYAQLEFVSVS